MPRKTKVAGEHPFMPSTAIQNPPVGAMVQHALGMRVSPVNSQSGVRRLTPVECARLQGFPDDHCAIEFNGKPVADGPQYKAYGNSMAVPVIRWIINRIEAMS